jgi:uncharacterized protein YecE (DUF72 family)
MSKGELRLGTAGWNVPAACRDRVGGDGSHLQRYAGVLDAVEINSSFHRPHRRTTYEKWFQTTPDHFRFSVKVPKSVTHVPGFTQAELERFIGEIAGLGRKLAVLLLQFAPSKVFDEAEAHTLFEALQAGSAAHLVCEPRHESWFTPKVDQWFVARRISRVAADPPRVTGADQPGGWTGLHYVRLHGSPRTYYSSYDGVALSRISKQLNQLRASAPTWCIFDNTALGAAMEDALTLKAAG